MEGTMPGGLVGDDAVAYEIQSKRAYDGRRFEEGEFVAILHGRVVAVGDQFEEVERELVRLAPSRTEGVVCLVAAPEPDVIR